MVLSRKELLDYAAIFKATELGRSLCRAAQSQITYMRELNKYRRAEIIFGENAGAKYWVKAELSFNKRNASLKYIKQNMRNHFDILKENHKKRLIVFLERGGLKEYALRAKKSVKLQLLHSNLKPEDTKNTLNKFDEIIQICEKIKSIDSLFDYLDQNFKEKIEKKIGNPSPELETPPEITVAVKGMIKLLRALCIAALAASMLLIAIIIAAAALTEELQEDGHDVEFEDIYNAIIDKFCPSA